MSDQKQQGEQAIHRTGSRWLVLAAALAYLGATVWQVAAHRDDWPLSSYPMFSHMQGEYMNRIVLMGIGEKSEFELEPSQMPAIRGARLRALKNAIAGNPKRRQRLMDDIVSFYRKRAPARHWPDLQGIRSYRERWRIQPGLKGMAHPKRDLVSSSYLPPPELLKRLSAEADGNAPRLESRRAPKRDQVFEVEAGGCQGCANVEDANASGGRAVELPGGSPRRSAVEFQAVVPEGSWYLFVRMKVAAGARDRLSLRVDGRSPAGARRGLGNYLGYLPRGAWVWASLEPGREPLRLELEGKTKRRFVLSASSPGILIDQVWLSKEQRELPVFNEALEP